MIARWLEQLGASAEAADKVNDAALLERVSAHLLIEVARADFDIGEDEIGAIGEAIKKTSTLADEEIDGIIAEANSEVEQALSYHQHVRTINDHFDPAMRQRLVEQMWRVAYADGRLDRYEEAFIRKFCDLIYVSHKQFMQAKLRVTGEWNG